MKSIFRFSDVRVFVGINRLVVVARSNWQNVGIRNMSYEKQDIVTSLEDFESCFFLSVVGKGILGGGNEWDLLELL